MRDKCVNNLRLIEAAKQSVGARKQETREHSLRAGPRAAISRTTLFPVCPDGGIYSINAVSVPPTCTIPDHVLPR